MDIIRKKIDISELNDFEKALVKLERFNRFLIVNLEEEYEEEGKIIDHKIFTLRKRKIDIEKVNKRKINVLIGRLDKLKRLEGVVLSSFRKLEAKLKKIGKKDEEKERYKIKLISYLLNDLREIFNTIDNALKISNGMKGDIEGGYDIKDMRHEISNLEGCLLRLEEFIRHIRHYHDYEEELIRVLKSKQFIKAKVIIKTEQYKEDFEALDEGLQERSLKEEGRIQTWPEFAKKHHELIRNGDFEGMRHGRVGKHRIMYSWNATDKILTYERLIHKDVLNKS